jgi:hypothetical protein
MLGKAMDFFLPDVKLSRLRELGLKMQTGGVGYYPKSGSPFVHMDVGSVRHWPRMSRRELMALFPNGETLYVPSDGKPLPGYKMAMANYEKRKRTGGSIQIARDSGSRGGGLLAGLFGGGADEEEDNAESAAPVRSRPAVQPAAKPAEDLPGVPAAAPPAAPSEVAVAALPARGPVPDLAPRANGNAPVAGAPIPASQPPVVAVAAVDPQLPESLPFGIGPSTPEPASPALEMALNIPLPTARPDYGGTIAVAQADAAPAVSDVQTTPDEAKLLMAMAAERPQEPPFGTDAGREAPVTVAAYAPVPDTRPAFPAASPPRPTAAAMARIPVTKHLAPAMAQDVPVIQQAEPASPRVAMLSAEEGPDRLRRVAFGAKTTAKGARPTVEDSRPDRRTVAVPLPQNVTRWALDENYVTTPRTATERAAAHDAVREAPKVVYAMGFQQDPVSDVNRFSGNAVRFMPVAKFGAN